MVLPASFNSASVGSPATSLCTELILFSEGFWRQACLSPVVDMKALKSYEMCSSGSWYPSAACSILKFLCMKNFKILLVYAQSDTRWLGKVGTVAKMGQFHIKYTNTTSHLIWPFVKLSSEFGLKKYQQGKKRIKMGNRRASSKYFIFYLRQKTHSTRTVIVWWT